MTTRGSVLIDFGAPASATCSEARAFACDAHPHAPAGPSPYDLLRSQCIANGWPPAEAAGDRDGGGVLRMSLVNRAGGWAGVGFNSQPQMAGADTVMMAAVSSAGSGSCSGLATCTTQITDGTATSRAMLTPDVMLYAATSGTNASGTQDVQLVVDAWVATDGTATFTITRPLRTSDPNNADLSVSGAPLFLLWAYAGVS